MATASSRIYELASEALSEQERRVEDVRRRAPVALTAAAVIATLLAKEVFVTTHPDGLAEWSAAALGIGGCVTVLVAAVSILKSRELGFSMDTNVLHRELYALGPLTEDESDLAIARAVNLRRANNEREVRTMHAWFDIALAGLMVQTVGLAGAAALAS